MNGTIHISHQPRAYSFELFMLKPASIFSSGQKVIWTTGKQWPTRRQRKWNAGIKGSAAHVQLFLRRQPGPVQARPTGPADNGTMHVCDTGGRSATLQQLLGPRREVVCPLGVRSVKCRWRRTRRSARQLERFNLSTPS